MAWRWARRAVGLLSVRKTRSRTLPSLLGALCACAITGVSGSADAWQQLTCPSLAPGGPDVPVNIGAKVYDKKPVNPPGGTYDFYYYNNRTNPTQIDILSNSNVAQIFPYYNYFHLESGYDWIHIYDNNHGFGSPIVYSGDLNDSDTLQWSGDYWTPMYTYGETYEYFTYHTDNSVYAWRPASFGQLEVYCKFSGQTTTALNGYPIGINERTDFILLGTGDTVYVNVNQPAGTAMVITMDEENGTAGADFDLAASTTSSTPNYGSEYVSSTFDPNEAVIIPVSGSDRSVYVGVHSYYGAGHVALHANVMRNYMGVTVCSFNSLTATDKTNLATTLRATSARLLTATAGNDWIGTWNVYSGSLPSSCNVFLDTQNNGTGAGLWSMSFDGNCSTYSTTGGIHMGSGDWRNSNWFRNSRTLMHELGHSCYYLGDRYEGNPAGEQTVTASGHSVMNNSLTRAFSSRGNCYDGHVYDTYYCDSVFQPPVSDWDEVAVTPSIAWGERYDQSPNNTPDPTDEFNNAALASKVNVNFM